MDGVSPIQRFGKRRPATGLDDKSVVQVRGTSALGTEPLDCPHVRPSGAPSTVHGSPIVSSAAVAAGTMLLVSQGAGVFYTKGGLRVDSGYNGDDSQRDLMTYRVDERILAAIVRSPAGRGSGDRLPERRQKR